MNEYDIKVYFEKNKIYSDLDVLVQNDYNSTKLNFTFDKTGSRVLFKLKYPDDTEYVDEIVNNELIFGPGILNQSGKYIYEISLYNEDSKLTGYEKGKFFVRNELINTDEIVIPDDRVPVLDQLINDVNENAAIVENMQEQAEGIITEANNLDLDVSKEGKTATVTLAKKDASTKTITLSDGTSLMFNWNGTSLGIKTDEDVDYTYVDLQGIQGPIGPKGEAFTIKKTYSSVAEMNADFYNMQLGDYVMIASTVEVEDNAKLYTRGESQWIFISDFSGATGIKGETGATPNIQIGTVTSGTTPSVTRTGTNENPILNFVLEKGQKGDTGDTGATGPTGNGIVSITKTSTSGLVDTYTITYTDGTTTTFEITNGEDGEVTQAQLDETNRAIDYYKSTLNALPKVEGQGTSLTLDNTAEAPMTMSLAPSELEQETTTGKNLFSSVLESGTISTSGTPSSSDTAVRTKDFISITPNTQYTLSSEATTIRMCFYDINKSFVGTHSATFTTRENEYYMKVAFSTTDTNIKNQLELGTTATDYEPYTGGIASPNPDYPQDIHTISGDNEIVLQNKNVLDLTKATYIDGSNISPTILTSNSIQFYMTTSSTTYAYKRYRLDLLIDNYKGKTLYVKFNSTNTNSRTLFRLLDSEYNPVGDLCRDQITIPSDTSASYISLVFYPTYSQSGQQGTTVVYSNIIVSTLDENYVPHQEQSLPLNLGVENLFNPALLSQDENYNTYDNITKMWTTSTKGAYGRSILYEVVGISHTVDTTKVIKVKPNTKYTIKFFDFINNTSASNSLDILYCDANGTNLSNLNSQTPPVVSFETPDDCEYIDITRRTNNGTFSFSKIMMVEGEYTEDTFPSFWEYGTEPLEYCKKGDYEDAFVYNTTDTSLELNKWYLKKNLYKKIFDGTENFTYAQSYHNFQYTLPVRAISTNSRDVKCNYFISGTKVRIGNVNNLVWFFDTEEYYENSVNNFKQDLANKYNNGNPMVLYYPRLNPTYILLNDTLQSQLTEIYKLVKAYQGQTNISQVNNDLPFVIKASAVYDLNKLLTRVETLEAEV